MPTLDTVFGRRMPLPTRRSLAWWLALPAAFAGRAKAQPDSAGETTNIDSDGTAHITRTVRVPKTLSAEAQAFMASG